MASSSLLSLSILLLILFSISSVNGIEAQTNQDSGQTRQKIPRKLGSQKESEGEDFDDGVYTGVREINFDYDPTTGTINTFQVTYDLNGEPHKGKRHGKPIVGHPLRNAKIALGFPKEYITELSGYNGKVEDYLVHSLTFKSNIKTYGPYGPDSGARHFNFLTAKGSLVGFKGTTGTWVENIGVYVSLDARN